MDVLLGRDDRGSGGCTQYSVVEAARHQMPVIHRQHLCDGEIRAGRGVVHIEEAVHRQGCHTHGCMGLLRVIELRWDGAGWLEIRDEVVPNP